MKDRPGLLLPSASVVVSIDLWSGKSNSIVLHVENSNTTFSSRQWMSRMYGISKMWRKPSFILPRNASLTLRYC